LPEVAHDYVSRVRVEVAANPAATKTQQPAQVGRIKTTQKHNANRTSYFINSIGHEPPRRFVAVVAAVPLITDSPVIRRWGASPPDSDWIAALRQVTLGGSPQRTARDRELS
jgi:hypothetical protein